VPSSAVVAPQGPTAGQAATLVVHVVGTVARPGIVTVPIGARVADAIAAAGGALPGTDMSSINLARLVTDGEQVVVGLPPPAVAPPTGAQGDGSAGVAGGPLDLNAATVDQLQDLPGVGPVLAQRIVEWRNANGRFTSVEELQEVSGIGEQRLAELRDLVRV
jgi:competence protein ComEA